MHFGPASRSDSLDTIGWIGTGVMGASMCGHLIARGFSATVYNRTRAKAERLLTQGAAWADSPRAVAERSDVVFTIVGFPRDVREVVLGPGQFDDPLTIGDFEAHLRSLYPGGRVTEPRLWRDLRFRGPAQPVVGICWYEARAYCLWLRAQSGIDFRLPTDAEWEAAARGPGGRAYAYGDTFDRWRENVLATHLRQQGKTRRLLAEKPRTYQRFEREHSNALWQGDAMVGPWLPDPNAPGKKRRAHLFCFLDDHSRLVPYAEFFFDEALPRLERVLKVGILRRGLPKAIYVDNAKVYSARQFEAACASLGIRKMHAAPYSPEAKGKQERFFSTVRMQFLPEVEASEITTLADLILRKDGPASATPGGSLKARVMVHPGIVRGVAAFEHGFGHRELGARAHRIGGQSQPDDARLAAGVNLNEIGLLDPTRPDKAPWVDAISGASVRNGLPARIRRA